MARNRDDTGRYVEVATLSEVLGVFGQVEGPVVTSGDVADALGCSRETARTKLGQLHDQGRVGRRKTAGRVVWWPLDDEDVDVDLETHYREGFGAFADSGSDSDFAAAVDRAHADLGTSFEERKNERSAPEP